MKNQIRILLAFACLAFCHVHPLMGETNIDYVMSVARCNTEPVIDRHHPGSADNDCGYENGHVIKIGETYHMLMTELFDYKPHPETLGSVPARVGYWTSKDGDNWERICTIVQGTATGSPDDYKDPKNNTWSSSWFWNEKENRWNIFWRGSWVWRYRSETEGPDGFAGPYSEAAKIYPPLDGEIPYWDNNSLDSFGNIYTAEDGKYYSFVGVGDFRNLDDIQWVNGLAWADKIDGPWARVNTDGHPTFVYSENPFVNIHEINGRKVYFCVYDDLSNQHSLGYGYSFDGVHWTGKTLDLTGHTHWVSNTNFVSSVRTPCCLIKEDDGTFTIIFTAFGPAPTPSQLYAPIGRVNVTIKEVAKPSDKNVVFPGDMKHWKPVSGDCTVQYGREYSLGFKDNGCDCVYTAETFTNVTVEAMLRYVEQTWDYASAKAGIYARKTDNQEGSGYRAYLTAKETVQLYAGSQLLREVWVGKRPGIFRNLKLIVKGNNIKVYCDGIDIPRIDVNDNTYPGEGSVGIETYRSHWHYERVEISKDQPVDATPAQHRKYYDSQVGLWYTIWWDSLERDPAFYEHHWVKETRIKPIKYGYYATDDPDKLNDDFRFFRRIGIDYLILDDTNGHYNDAGNLAAHIDACFAAASQLKNDAPKLCFAGGRPLIDGDVDGMQAELDIFAGYAEKYRDNTFFWKGKPLFVNFNIPENYSYQDKHNRFTMRPAAGHLLEGFPYYKEHGLDKTGMYGWVFDMQYDTSEVYGITPGFSRSHNDLGTTLDPISRENGERYQREWLNAVKRKPEMIVISSWNDHAEETGIEAVELREPIPGRGKEDPFFYEKITEGYLALKTGYLEHWYYRSENDSQIYQYRDNRLHKVSHIGDQAVVIVVPDDYFDWAGVPRD